MPLRTLKGCVKCPGPSNRVICYCRDCQAFAHFLGGSGDILDARGGSDVIQVLPANVSLSEGVQSLACMRLSDKGLLRWYATCCRTPIGNTLADHRFSFIGLLHECLASADQSLDASFGAVRMHTFTGSARGTVPANKMGVATGIARIAAMMLRDRIDGNYRRNPLFTANGIPIVTPVALGHEERQRLRSSVLRRGSAAGTRWGTLRPAPGSAMTQESAVDPS